MILADNCQRGYIQVDLGAIRDNMIHMKQHIHENTKMLAVIKTDGYGHGSVPIARELENLDVVYGYAVATAEEAFEIRDGGMKKPILILGYSFPYAYERFVREDIYPTVFRRDMLEDIVAAAKKVGKKAKVHIKVDTGMGRIGIQPDDEGLLFVKEVLSKEELTLDGMFTHFACADMADKTSANHQLSLFHDFVDRVESELGYSVPYRHASNSAAIMEMKDANMDLVRAGVTMYGLMPSDEVDMSLVSLKPALGLYSQVVFVKDLKAGMSVSYGSTFTATKDMRVATIPLGYGDGYPRSLSSKGYVLIRGKKAPILGRVCMDQFMVDVTDIPDAVEGDKVTLIGTDGSESITADYLGELSGRFNYELVCELNPRLPRIYVKNGEFV